MNRYVVILAGGKGSRLWPISTEKRPKQFLNLYGNEIMVNETIKRIESVIDYENIFIFVNEIQKEMANRYIDSRIPRENIICEPESKSTAMCIFYATLKIRKMKGDGIVCVLSSDHYIEKENELIKNINYGMQLAEKNDVLLTIGITPTYPSTEFGYIKYNEGEDFNSIIEFKEKPDYKTAVEYINSNQYVWNTGMYIWKTDLILKKFQEYMPDIHKYQETLYNAIKSEEEQEVVREIYGKVENISICEGIFEKADDIKMIKADFKWMDIGSIKDFFEIYPKDNSENVIIGEAVIEDTNKSNILNNSEELLVAIGLENVNIIKDNGVCIICSKEKHNVLTQILRKIKEEEKYKKYL